MLPTFIRQLLPSRAGLLGALVLGLTAAAAQAQTKVYGLGSDYGDDKTVLIAFELGQPDPVAYSKVTFNRPVTGVASGQFLAGLDSRPATGALAALGGQLFALGYDATRQEAQLYRLDPTTAAATMVGPVQKIDLGSDRNRIGFDFSSDNMIRVTGSNGTALFFSSENGLKLLTDAGSSLAYAADDPNAGHQPFVGSSAYINDQSYPGVRLYHLDEPIPGYTTIAVQPTTSTGTLRTVGTGPYIFTSSSADLDIYTDPISGANTAYMCISDPDFANFTTHILIFDLATGTRTIIGRVITGTKAVLTDIALAIQPVGVATGTRNPAVATSFSLFPNPVTDRAQVSFRLPGAGATELVLTDALGRTVERHSLGNRAVGAHSLNWTPASHRAGIYLLRLLVDGQLAGVQRMVVE
ncbi:DUF4394 domain-containing protein [Hymenobacter actinosclerus]|uniref:Por secretion system C-terminal sorting domain-containing protein n=1 Tax=Hymenobacter actinosclerus TaxID=82805 RepID=A0A1I0AX70_9BACT|nr:DUF4394 domain-containing protein [Hymenobacter actinosclerus]SES99032.1 Por secretion system C-terminal sorting domain-containing protein [Hymenobacter actinosclerus]